MAKFQHHGAGTSENIQQNVHWFNASTFNDVMKFEFQFPFQFSASPRRRLTREEKIQRNSKSAFDVKEKTF